MGRTKLAILEETPNFSSLSRVPGKAASELDVVKASSAGSKIALVRRLMHGPTITVDRPIRIAHSMPSVR